MNRFKRVIALMLIVVLSMASVGAVQATSIEGEDISSNAYSKSARNVAVEGWNGSGNRWQYFEKDAMGNVVPVSGWRDVAKKRFYFDPADGNYAATGLKQIGRKTYYFETKGGQGVAGSMVIGWKKVGKKSFYFKKTGGVGVKGEMLLGWQKNGKKTFYFKKTGTLGEKGQLLTGWQSTGKKSYYFKKTGADGTKGMMLTGLLKLSGKIYYTDKNGVMQRNKWVKVSKDWYYFDKNGEALRGGWKYVGGYKFYFAKNGKLDQDVRDMVRGPYVATINRKKCVVTIYAKDGNRGYTIPVKAFTCSVGLPGTPTPTGTFSTSAKYRVHELMGPSWGQYCTRIVGGVLFHSVAGTRNIPYNISAGAYNLLGSPASHGCVRLSVRDAKWIYDNCSLRMRVTISDNAYQPFDKPATIKIPASQNWDPTDPNVRR
jgi:FOG: Glucan-binding domain (YG repeat)